MDWWDISSVLVQGSSHKNSQRGCKALLRGFTPGEKSVPESWCKQINLSARGEFQAAHQKKKKRAAQQYLLDGTLICIN